MVKISDGRVAAKGDSNFTDKSSYSFEDKKLFFIKSILHIPEVYILYVRFWISNNLWDKNQLSHFLQIGYPYFTDNSSYNFQDR